MFGLDLSAMLYYIVVFDALLVLLVGVVAAGMHLAGSKFDVFMERVVPAVATLVGTSLAAGVIMWIAAKMFA